MTKDDVISAAFRVWGRELYKTTSLAKIAETLSVSKPAIYRHFPGKQALLEEMEDRFYDDYAAAVKPSVEEALKKSLWQERLLEMVRFITGYFARHFDYLIFSLIKLHGNKERHFFNIEPLERRGVSFRELGFHISKDFPSPLFLVGITALFGTGMFHKQQYGIKHNAMPRKPLEEAWFSKIPSEKKIHDFSGIMVESVRLGLGYDRTVIDTLPYEKLEASGAGVYTPPAPLFKAIAEVVAEEGPWNTSMETVAKRSGLSKSGLYAHFKSKSDMLSRLFMSEFDQIAQCTAARTVPAKTREERLYLAILSIAEYLWARPEILAVLDWVRIQRLELDLSVPTALYDFFAAFKTDSAPEILGESTSQWILFLLVTVLMHSFFIEKKDKTELAAKTPPVKKLDHNSLRRLFRFICLGLEGLE